MDEAQGEKGKRYRVRLKEHRSEHIRLVATVTVFTYDNRIEEEK